jgi:hypothetical protein
MVRRWSAWRQLLAGKGGGTWRWGGKVDGRWWMVDGIHRGSCLSRRKAGESRKTKKEQKNTKDSRCLQPE